jgi:hypothetical protein
MTDRGWKAAPTNLDCFGVLEWWSAGVMEITNHKYQTNNPPKAEPKFKIQKGHREKQ